MNEPLRCEDETHRRPVIRKRSGARFLSRKNRRLGGRHRNRAFETVERRKLRSPKTNPTARELPSALPRTRKPQRRRPTATAACRDGTLPREIPFSACPTAVPVTCLRTRAHRRNGIDSPTPFFFADGKWETKYLL
ncbi:MAG: hypothetical protein D6741_00225 [Planctomycetota bacterium]|nr:MAG: hypothetical protein D6741_00225 [Planctomycetota bacterium]